MARIDEKTVLNTLTDLINSGRKPENQITITGRNTPSDIISKLTPNDVASLDILNAYRGISANEYTVKASLLWTSLFWKIGEQILIVGNYMSPFERFFTELQVGTDIEEVAPRIKDGLDRMDLPNSALLTNYVTRYDSFYHRINQFKVFASTYDRYEIERISNSWSNLTNMLNAELENVLKSSNVYIHDLVKDAFASQYYAGGCDVISLPTISSEFTAAQCAIAINTAIDKMTTEATTAYIPFNLNANNDMPNIRDIANSNILLVATPELLNNIEFLTTLNTYFQGTFANKKFALNTIKVDSFPTSLSPNISITPGYTPRPDGAPLKGFLIEEDGLIAKQKQFGTYNFDNAATLKTTIFRHLDAMVNLSDRRKCVALV